MNQKTMTYIILLCMIIISLGIGMYFFTIREGAAGSLDNKGIGVNVGNILKDENGDLVVDSMGNNFIIKHLTSRGIVDKVDPDIQLNRNGFAIKNANGNPIPNQNNTSTEGDDTRYNKDNLDVEYHKPADEIAAESDYKDLQDGTVYVTNQDGELVAIPKSNVQGSITYYQPNSYRFGASTYVPTYEDSVYLSRTTGQTTIGAFDNPTIMYGGVCSNYKDQPAKLEEECQKINPNNCASTSCCVLLGGKKCVTGNEQGPTVRSNYSDVYVPNRDFYYYQGKCYGNCP